MYLCFSQIIHSGPYMHRFILGRFFSHYQPSSNESQRRNSHYYSSTVCHKIDMVNREVNTSYRDADKFFHGFMPVWALTLFGIAIMFAIIFFVGLICHWVGCRTPKQNLTNNIHSSIVQQPFLSENDQLQTVSIQSNK